MRRLQMVIALVMVGTFMGTLPLFAEEPGYVGAKLCSACHKYQSEQWKTTAHATAASPLSAEQKADAQCMACHGTGAAQGNLGEKWENVQCEACHGPGQQYVKLKAKWKKNPEETRKLAMEVGFRLQNEEVCLGCHGQARPEGHPPTKPFDYNAAYPLVAHKEPKE